MMSQGRNVRSAGAIASGGPRRRRRSGSMVSGSVLLMKPQAGHCGSYTNLPRLCAISSTSAEHPWTASANPRLLSKPWPTPKTPLPSPPLPHTWVRGRWLQRLSASWALAAAAGAVANHLLLGCLPPTPQPETMAEAAEWETAALQAPSSLPLPAMWAAAACRRSRVARRVRTKRPVDAGLDPNTRCTRFPHTLHLPASHTRPPRFTFALQAG